MMRWLAFAATAVGSAGVGAVRRLPRRSSPTAFTCSARCSLLGKVCGVAEADVVACCWTARRHARSLVAMRQRIQILARDRSQRIGGVLGQKQLQLGLDLIEIAE